MTHVFFRRAPLKAVSAANGLARLVRDMRNEGPPAAL
jgi:hypothetical protein